MTLHQAYGAAVFLGIVAVVLAVLLAFHARAHLRARAELDRLHRAGSPHWAKAADYWERIARQQAARLRQYERHNAKGNQ